MNRDRSPATIEGSKARSYRDLGKISDEKEPPPDAPRPTQAPGPHDNRFGLPWILRRTALTNGASDLLSVALVEFSQGEVPLAQRRPFGSTPKDRCEQQREDQ